MSDRIRVTDHAVLRYLERVVRLDTSAARREHSTNAAVLGAVVRAYGLDLAAVRSRILTPEAQQAIHAGACKFQTQDYTLVIQSQRVITIIEGRIYRSPARKAKRKRPVGLKQARRAARRAAQ